MGTVYTTERILKEIQRLDRLTGLDGANLEIRKCTGKSRLGYFAYYKGQKPYFAFSVTYFEDTEFPDAEKITTIEHEYAHFMDYKETGFTSHGPNWKKCCNRINTSPARCLSKTSVEYYKNFEKQQAERRKFLNSMSDKLSIGKKILHPKFGTGTILSFSGTGQNDSAVIEFENSGEKTMSVGWIYDNLFAANE